MEKKENEVEQPNLFGDQDFVYDTINGHILDINDEISRLLKSKDKIDDKVKKLKEQKKKDVEALNIVGKEIKKSRPENEEKTELEKEVEEEVKEPEIVEEETEEETKDLEAPEDPFE